ncbi:MAG: hypothetical protein HYZ16_09090 [Bacteroidetes bacterium]|jgi:hypothetical protein|nr:hypothetical protein [Bacteroidota bacterium]
MMSARLLFMFLLAMVFAVACGNKADGPLSQAELDEIEEIIIKAIQKDKLTLYSDKSLEHIMALEDFNKLLPTDSTGRQDLSGYGILSEEEVALHQGNFDNNSTELEGVSLYVMLQAGGIDQYLPIAIIRWKDLAKELNVNYKRRLYEYLLGHFQTHIDDYRVGIAKARLECINEKLFAALKSGKLAAYENDNLANVKSPQELESYLAHKEEQYVDDPENPGEDLLQFVEVPIGAADITNYLAATDEEGNIVAITMMIRESIQGYFLYQPWVAMDMEEVKQTLSPTELQYLLDHMAQNAEPDSGDSTITDTVNAAS